jgi:hypothetical protein
VSISPETRLLVRERAHFACEYCGVTETDSGGELTVDHFHPQTLGGIDDPANLLYCCNRCNQYKRDYWPKRAAAPQLWNPRLEPASNHVLTLPDGTLHALTPVGTFTIRRLRLNRPPLVAHRRQRQEHAERDRLLRNYQDIVESLRRLAEQQARLLADQHDLLHQQHDLLRLLLGSDDTGDL